MPPEVHAALPQAAKDGFPQFFAKNVGLRRARGKFVLVINGDILIGEVCGIASMPLRCLRCANSHHPARVFAGAAWNHRATGIARGCHVQN